MEIQFYNVSMSNDSPLGGSGDGSNDSPPGGSGTGLINRGSCDGSNDSPPGGSGVGLIQGCIFLLESSGFLYFPFRSPVSHINFRSAVILFIGIKRSKNLRSKTKAMGALDVTSACLRVPSGTVLRLAIVKSLAATLVLLHA